MGIGVQDGRCPLGELSVNNASIVTAPPNQIAPTPNHAPKVSGSQKGPDRTPLYVYQLSVQSPADGPFTINDLQWLHQGKGNKAALVAAIPEHRFVDFVAGEEKRGMCEVKIRVQNKETDKTPMNKKAECIFGPPRNTSEKNRQAMPTSAKPLSQPGKTGRRCAHQNGTSCKMHCTYRFFAVRYGADPRNAVFIRFPTLSGETKAPCKSMKHHTIDGQCNHAGQKCQHHLKKPQKDVEKLILMLLKNDLKPAAIIAGVALLHVHLLSISHCLPKVVPEVWVDMQLFKMLL